MVGSSSRWNGKSLQKNGIIVYPAASGVPGSSPRYLAEFVVYLTELPSILRICCLFGVQCPFGETCVPAIVKCMISRRLLGRKTPPKKGEGIHTKSMDNIKKTMSFALLSWSIDWATKSLTSCRLDLRWKCMHVLAHAQVEPQMR